MVKGPPLSVFLSYSHRDEALRRSLQAHLALLEREGLIAIWHDRKIRAGEDWAERISDHLETADLVLLLVSSEFLASEYCFATEMARALERHEDGTARVVPILVRACDWQSAPFGKLQAVPRDNRAVASRADRDAAWTEVAKELRAVVQEIQARRAGKPPPEPEPRYPNERLRGWSRRLKKAYTRLEETTVAGGDTSVIEDEIGDLRRRLREGGLAAGDFLAGGHLRLIDEIGSGGFATVWKAWDRRDRTAVAIKILHARYARDASRRERFLRGAKRMAALRHPGIVRVLESEGRDGRFFFFVMELADDGDLHRAILDRRIPDVGERLRLVAAVGEALAHAHEQGVIHRDVKPHNVLLDGAGKVRLTDFDLVRAVDSAARTRTGSMLGTFGYAAPEVLFNAKEAGVAADVYGLGMTAAFAVYGKDLPPEVIRDGPGFVERLEAAAGVRNAIAKAVSWEPEERYPSVSEFCEELRVEQFAARREPPAAGPPASDAVIPLPLGRRRRRAPASRTEAPKTLRFPSEAKPGEAPPIDLLRTGGDRHPDQEDELLQQGEVVLQAFGNFGIEGSIEGIIPGPVINVFELRPAPGIKVSRIVNLQDDLALALKAESVRIDRLAGRSTLGIEVPNRDRRVIRLGEILASDKFRRAPSVLTLALGVDIYGRPYFADLATMPHLLVAGATGAGKSVGLQSMITSILYKASREQVQFIFIDPKRIELGVYRDLPHLKTEVVVEPRKAANALRWAVVEMERRYRLLAEVHVRSIDYYNRAVGDPEERERLRLGLDEGGLQPGDLQPLPYYVIVIDELADLMMVSSSEVEASIARLAQMARAVGIHLIVATQRPSVDVLTGTIKANFPCRLSYATATRHDSRIILDTVGAEKLLGKGDALFMPPRTSRILRLHGGLVTEQETAALIRWLKRRGKPDLDLGVLEDPEAGTAGAGRRGGDDDLFDEATRLVVAERQASASFLQRRMRIGFSRAARLIDMMEADGILGPARGSKPREVLAGPEYFD